MAEQQLFLTSGMNSWHAAEQGVDAEKGAHLSQKVLVDCSDNSETFLIVKHQIIFFIGKHRCY